MWGTDGGKHVVLQQAWNHVQPFVAMNTTSFPVMILLAISLKRVSPTVGLTYLLSMRAEAFRHGGDVCKATTGENPSTP